MLYPALDTGEKKETLCHARYLIMKNLPCLVGSFLLLLSGDPLATSPERIVWREERTYMQVPPFSPDCTRLEYSLWMKFRVKLGAEILHVRT